MPDEAPRKLKLKPEGKQRFSTPEHSPTRQEWRPPYTFLRRLTILLVLCVGAYWLKGGDRSWLEFKEDTVQWFEDSLDKATDLKDQVAEDLDSEDGQQPVRPPANGTEFIYHSHEGVMPFEIHNKSPDMHTIVKLEDYESGEPVAKYFVRAGQMIEKDLPLGKYRLKSAAGKNWYGEPILFGSKTQALVMTVPITVTQKGDMLWINHRAVELNIDLPIWSQDRNDSKTMNQKSW